MNTDELGNALRQALNIVFWLLIVRGVVTKDQATALMTDFAIIGPAAAGAATIAWSIYAHWNMKKVPENSVAILPQTPVAKGSNATGIVVGAIALCLLLSMTYAHAQTVTKAPATAASPLAYSPCTPLSCSGIYTGFNIGEGMLNANVGAQFWNGVAFVGVETGAGGQVYTNPAYTVNENGFFAYQIAKAGGSLSGLLGTPTSPPTNFPTSLTANIIAPYALAGAVERDLVTGWQEGWAVGGGIEYEISAHLFADAKYIYVNYGGDHLPAESLVLAGVNYKF